MLAGVNVTVAEPLASVKRLPTTLVHSGVCSGCASHSTIPYSMLGAAPCNSKVAVGAGVLPSIVIAPHCRGSEPIADHDGGSGVTLADFTRWNTCFSGDPGTMPLYSQNRSSSGNTRNTPANVPFWGNVKAAILFRCCRP